MQRSEEARRPLDDMANLRWRFRCRRWLRVERSWRRLRLRLEPLWPRLATDAATACAHAVIERVCAATPKLDDLDAAALAALAVGGANESLLTS
jgi:hypothetical protein